MAVDIPPHAKLEIPVALLGFKRDSLPFILYVQMNKALIHKSKVV